MKLAEKAMKKDELFGEFRRYAVLKKQQKRNPDAMDVDAVNQRRRGSKKEFRAVTRVQLAMDTSLHETRTG